MFVVEILLPTTTNTGEPFPKTAFDQIRRELTERFGGVTAFMRAPADGLWEDEAGTLRRDDIVVFEVMVQSLDRVWWRGYREDLEVRFRQEEVVIRASSIKRL